MVINNDNIADQALHLYWEFCWLFCVFYDLYLIQSIVNNLEGDNQHCENRLCLFRVSDLQSFVYKSICDARSE